MKNGLEKVEIMQCFPLAINPAFNTCPGWRCNIIDEPAKVKEECVASLMQRYERRQSRQKAEEKRHERHCINLLLISKSPTG